MKTIIELMQELEAKQNAVNEILDKAGDADLSKEDIASLTTLETSMKPIEDEIAERRQTQEAANGIRGRAEARQAMLNEPANRPAQPIPGNNANQQFRAVADSVARRTIGERFVNDPEYKKWLDTLAPVSSGGHIPETKRVGNGPPVIFEGIGYKALLTGVSDTSAGAMVRTDYYNLVSLPFRPLMIRDIITIGTTGTDTVEFPRVTSQTNNAAAVAEATATSGGSGVKPESELALEKVTTAVKTVAHWIPATKRAMSDAGQTKTLIDNFLQYGLEEELEDQIIRGNGAGENFTGLENTSGTTTQAFTTNKLTTTRKARTAAMVTGRARSTAFLMNPTDWEAMDLSQDNEARYYFGGPTVMGNPRLWGLPVVESEAVTAGTAWTGDFKQLVLWDREQSSISASDSHSDFFIRNMVAFLAELRAAFGILRPAALVEVPLS